MEIRLQKRRVTLLTEPLGLLGLVAVALHNWRLWQRDKELLNHVVNLPPLPTLNVWPEQPLVSVLVAALNEADHIQSHIESFLALRYAHKELILCAGGDDGTYQLARQYDEKHSGRPVFVLEQKPGEGKQRSLRRCFRWARGQLIYLTDADCFLDDETFEQMILPLLQGESAATGSQRPFDQQLENPFVLYQWYYHTYATAQSSQYVDGLEGRNTALWREALEQVNGFDADVPIGTDYYLSRQLVHSGLRIRYVPRSQIRTRYATTLADYIKQRSRWQRNILLHGVKAWAWRSVRNGLQRALVGLLMLTFPFIALCKNAGAGAVWGNLAAHGLLSRIRYMRFSERIHRESALVSNRCGLLILYMFVDFIAWGAGLIDALFPERRWRW